MKNGFVVVTRPGNEISIKTADEQQFIELRSLHPYHRTEKFVRHANGQIDALLIPLTNVVPINGKYMRAAA